MREFSTTANCAIGGWCDSTVSRQVGHGASVLAGQRMTPEQEEELAHGIMAGTFLLAALATRRMSYAVAITVLVCFVLWIIASTAR